jgi:hypothetical protein
MRPVDTSSRDVGYARTGESVLWTCSLTGLLLLLQMKRGLR